VLFMLGPEDEVERVANSKVVLKQEADSYHRAYVQFAEFTQFKTLVPSVETVAVYERRRLDLLRDGRPPGEARTLDSMAEVIGAILARSDSAVSQQELLDLATSAKEHVRWIFHVYSGVAHGFAWPWLVPRTESLPGHFISDLTTTVNVASLAVDASLRRAGISME
jgi:hypothetical protein